MSETISLLAAVRENPDERTVRLAAADHIRESDPERLRTAALLASSGPVYVTADGKVRPRLTVADSGDTPGTYEGYINLSPCGGGWVHSAESAHAENQRCGYQTDLPGIHWPGAVEAGSVEAYTGDDVGDDSCYLDGLRDGEDDADEYREWLAGILARESVRVCEAHVEAEAREEAERLAAEAEPTEDEIDRAMRLHEVAATYRLVQNGGTPFAVRITVVETAGHRHWLVEADDSDCPEVSVVGDEGYLTHADAVRAAAERAAEMDDPDAAEGDE